MTCCVEAAIRSYKYIIAKCYFTAVQNNGIVICKKVLADFDIVSIVAPKRSNYRKRSLCFAELPFHFLSASLIHQYKLLNTFENRIDIFFISPITLVFSSIHYCFLPYFIIGWILFGDCFSQ